MPDLRQNTQSRFRRYTPIILGGLGFAIGWLASAVIYSFAAGVSFSLMATPAGWALLGAVSCAAIAGFGSVGIFRLVRAIYRSSIHKDYEIIPDAEEVAENSLQAELDSLREKVATLEAELERTTKEARLEKESSRGEISKLRARIAEIKWDKYSSHKSTEQKPQATDSGTLRAARPNRTGQGHGRRVVTQIVDPKLVQKNQDIHDFEALLSTFRELASKRREEQQRHSPEPPVNPEQFDSTFIHNFNELLETETSFIKHMNKTVHQLEKIKESLADSIPVGGKKNLLRSYTTAYVQLDRYCDYYRKLTTNPFAELSLLEEGKTDTIRAQLTKLGDLMYSPDMTERIAYMTMISKQYKDISAFFRENAQIISHAKKVSVSLDSTSGVLMYASMAFQRITRYSLILKDLHAHYKSSGELKELLNKILQRALTFATVAQDSLPKNTSGAVSAGKVKGLLFSKKDTEQGFRMFSGIPQHANEYREVIELLMKSSLMVTDEVKKAVEIINSLIPAGDVRELSDLTLKIDVFIVFYYLHRIKYIPSVLSDSYNNDVINKINDVYQAIINAFSSFKEMAQFLVDNKDNKKFKEEYAQTALKSGIYMMALSDSAAATVLLSSSDPLLSKLSDAQLLSVLVSHHEDGGFTTKMLAYLELRKQNISDMVQSDLNAALTLCKFPNPYANSLSGELVANILVLHLEKLSDEVSKIVHTGNSNPYIYATLLHKILMATQYSSLSMLIEDEQARTILCVDERFKVYLDYETSLLKNCKKRQAKGPYLAACTEDKVRNIEPPDIMPMGKIELPEQKRFAPGKR